jgi:hypothetical protein
VIWAGAGRAGGWTNLNARRPVSRPLSAAIALRACSAPASIARACGRSTSPARCPAPRPALGAVVAPPAAVLVPRRAAARRPPHRRPAHAHTQPRRHDKEQSHAIGSWVAAAWSPRRTAQAPPRPGTAPRRLQVGSLGSLLPCATWPAAGMADRLSGHDRVTTPGHRPRGGTRCSACAGDARASVSRAPRSPR